MSSRCGSTPETNIECPVYKGLFMDSQLIIGGEGGGTLLK